jgi:hypothetical protein
MGNMNPKRIAIRLSLLLLTLAVSLGTAVEPQRHEDSKQKKTSCLCAFVVHLNCGIAGK